MSLGDDLFQIIAGIHHTQQELAHAPCQHVAVLIPVARLQAHGDF